MEGRRTSRAEGESWDEESCSCCEGERRSVVCCGVVDQTSNSLSSSHATASSAAEREGQESRTSCSGSRWGAWVKGACFAAVV